MADAIDTSSYLTIPEAAQRCGRSEITVRRCIRSGSLPAVADVRDGRRKHLVDPDELDRVLAPKRVGAEADLDARIDALVAQAPELSVGQRARIAAAFAGAA